MSKNEIKASEFLAIPSVALPGALYGGSEGPYTERKHDRVGMYHSAWSEVRLLAGIPLDSSGETDRVFPEHEVWASSSRWTGYRRVVAG